MAASSSNPSFIVEIGEKYPIPSHVCTPILVTVKLSGKDSYNAWKTQILCLLTSHNMLGFINGKVVKPKGNMHRIEAWMRSDSIVKSWILGTLSEEVSMHVVNRLTPKNPNVDFTAKDVWDELECIYGPESIQQAIGSSSNSSLTVEIREGYPYPSHISTPSLSVKLSDRGKYHLWKTQMVCFLKGHDMLGFIDGKFVSKGNGKAKMEDTEAWIRSDALVVSWILGTLSEEVSMYVVNGLTTSMNPNVVFTAKDVWDQLERIYGPKIIQQAIGETEIAIEEDAKSEDNSKEEETNEEESETDSLSLQDYYNIWKKRCRGYYKNNIGEKKLICFERRFCVQKLYEKLYECIVKGKMNLVNDVLRSGEVSLTDKITNNGDTALHVAVGTSKDLEFFSELLEMARKTNISLADLKNSHGSTLLHIAATVGNTEAAEILMKEYPEMLTQQDNDGQTPLAVGFSCMNLNDVYWGSLELTKQNQFVSVDKKNLFTDKLLELAISFEEFYLARNLIWWECKNLDSDAALMAIAQKYPCELSFWERRVSEFEDTPIANVLIELPFVKRRLKYRHEAFQVLLGICKFIQFSIRSSHHKYYYTNPVLEATRLNALDVVKVLVYHFPDAFYSAGEDGHNVIQHAVINRSEKIYNLLHEMSEHKNVYKTIKDASGNNLLHLAARLAPSEKLNLISGAALQIQYELQWYEEVEGFVGPLNKTEKNSFEETPKMVFTRTHKALVSDGEKWMRSTAESYTITAALITTIVFAAAITVPGGNTQDTGVPIFTNNPAFTIFAVSDAISLFTAVMSLLMFLSILTARFAEEDFLYKLPRRLIIGLVTLFISTTTMIIAFGAASFIVFGQNKRSLLIPIGALTGLTITFFVALQFPLLVDLMRATYGHKIFGKRNGTSKKCLQNYINKMTCQPIVEDKKEGKENMMEIDWKNVHDYSRYNLVHCDDIPFNI